MKCPNCGAIWQPFDGWIDVSTIAEQYRNQHIMCITCHSVFEDRGNMRWEPVRLTGPMPKEPEAER